MEDRIIAGKLCHVHEGIPSDMDEIKILQTERDQLYHQVTEINKKIEALTIEVRERAVDIALKEGLLKSVIWELHRSASSWPKDQPWRLTGLNLKKQIVDKQAYDRLEKLFHYDYHCESILSFEARLRWDDGELTLILPSFDALKQFVLEHRLVINIEMLQGSRSQILLDLCQKNKQLKEIEATIDMLRDEGLCTIGNPYNDNTDEV